MYHLKDRNSLKAAVDEGRIKALAISPAIPENTKNMMAGFARFSYEYGHMTTHAHGSEYMYVIDAYNAVVKCGQSPDELSRVETLHPGDIVRQNPGEWHRFDFLTEDGFVDFLNFFADFSDAKPIDISTPKQEEG